MYVGIAVHEQNRLLDTILNYIFHFGSPVTDLQTSRENRLSVGQQRVGGLGDLSTAVSWRSKIENIVKCCNLRLLDCLWAAFVG